MIMNRLFISTIIFLGLVINLNAQVKQDSGYLAKIGDTASAVSRMRDRASIALD